MLGYGLANVLLFCKLFYSNTAPARAANESVSSIDTNIKPFLLAAGAQQRADWSSGCSLVFGLRYNTIATANNT